MKNFCLGARRVGPTQPCFVIAEVAQAHDGSLGQAHAFIDAIADSGADAAKFQTHIASAESTLDEPFRVKFSKQDATRYGYWRRMEFTAEQWQGLADHCRERGLVFLSSPFSLAAVELLESLDVPAWKFGSGEVAVDNPLLRRVLGTGKPVLLSSGLSGYAGLGEVVEVVRSAGSPFALFQCTSRYPVPLEEVGLNVVGELRGRFDCPVGLSDHSGQVWSALAAVARGCDLLEVHVTFDRRMFGPDTIASLTFDELTQVCRLRDACALMDSHPVDKDALAAQLVPTRNLFTKSLAPVRDLPVGTILDASMITGKKPGIGIPVAQLGQVVGRTLARAVAADRLLSWSDLAEEE